MFGLHSVPPSVLGGSAFVLNSSEHATATSSGRTTMNEKTVHSRWQSPHKQQENGQMVEGLGTLTRVKVDPKPG